MNLDEQRQLDGIKTKAFGNIIISTVDAGFNIESIPTGDTSPVNMMSIRFMNPVMNPVKNEDENRFFYIELSTVPTSEDNSRQIKVKWKDRSGEEKEKFAKNADDMEHIMAEVYENTGLPLTDLAPKTMYMNSILNTGIRRLGSPVTESTR